MQKLAQEFVCAADECWDLSPPDWFDRQWLKTPKSTNLFEKYLKNTPKDLIPEKTSTFQGTYCMTAEGEYLAGGFAWVNRERTIELLESALSEFSKTGSAMKTVPRGELPLFMGKKPEEGGLKLQLGYRDLPRGENRLPNTKRIQRPVNLGFLDLSEEEVALFRVEKGESKELPQSLVKKISQKALKDCARGQCNADKETFRGGTWTLKEVSREGDKQVIELRGSSQLEGGGQTFAPTVFGRLEFDLTEEEFKRFDLVAVGQRTGSGEFNFRWEDEEAAPLGVAFRLFADSKQD